MVSTKYLLDHLLHSACAYEQFPLLEFTHKLVGEMLALARELELVSRVLLSIEMGSLDRLL